MRPPRTRRSAVRLAACLAVLTAALAAAEPALAARPFIHAHRGGSLEFGKPVYPESTLPAYRHAASLGFVLELDVKLTSDRVPVVIHDATLDRTTPCTGNVAARTFAQLRADCPSDILGTNDQLRAARARRPPPRADPQALRGARAGQGEGRAAEPGDQEPPHRPGLRPDQRLRQHGGGRDRGLALPALPPDRAVVLPAEPERGEEPPTGRGDELPHPGIGPRLDRRAPARTGTTGSHRSGRSPPSSSQRRTPPGSASCPTRSTRPRTWPPPRGPAWTS